MVDFTPAIDFAIALIMSVIARYLIPWIKAKTTERNREDLLAWVDIAVMAAQQMFYQMRGSERLEYVLDFLEDKGFNIDDASVRNAIEAAVFTLHQSMEE